MTIWTFVSKVMSLLFNMLSGFVIALLPRSKHLLISWLQSLSAVILEPKKIKSATVCIFYPSICHEVMGPDAMIFIFLNAEFQTSFFTLLFYLHQEALYFFIILNLFIFLPTILIPACASSSPAFHMMYSVHKLNKQADNIQA